MYQSNAAEAARKAIEDNGFMAFSTSGMSMYPFLKNRRDVCVALRITKPVGKYDVLLYEDDSHRFVLHRVIKVRKDRAYIRGDNCVRGEWVHKDRYIAILDQFTRKGKEGKCTDFGYKFYSRFIVLFHPVIAASIIIKEFVYKVYCRLFKKRQGDR